MIDVDIEDEAWTADLSNASRVAAIAAQAAMDSAGSGELDVTVLLTTDAAVADLNQRFRGKAGPTNVLSFPAAVSARPHLGDIALAHGVCAREARDQGKTLEHHLMHLVAHGVLHLVGYDHESDADAERMEALERRLMRGFGAPDPYEPPAPTKHP